MDFIEHIEDYNTLRRLKRALKKAHSSYGQWMDLSRRYDDAGAPTIAEQCRERAAHFRDLQDSLEAALGVVRDLPRHHPAGGRGG